MDDWTQRDVLLIFDLDGTLFQSETVTVPAVRQSFHGIGLAAPPDTAIHDFFGRPHADFQVWLRSLIPSAQADTLLASVDRRELELVGLEGRLYPGVPEMLLTLRARVNRMAICTNGEREYVNRVVEAQDLGRYFDVLRHRQTDTDTKTTMVKELLARFRPEAAVMIGDRWDDVASARGNAILSVGAGYGYGGTKELLETDAIVETPHQLPEVIDRLLGGSAWSTTQVSTSHRKGVNG
ncbi:HAD hydrolase-like protein [Candidatus Fermentibacteria bacterium]|nr:HAD hydrolase-like protein [Candidatus Fermentibacteria bacterium]